MDKTKRDQRLPLQTLQRGQIWRMTDSTLQVERLGEAQVHYKLVKPSVKVTPTSISDIKVVETFLMVKRAVLVQG